MPSSRRDPDAPSCGRRCSASFGVTLRIEGETGLIWSRRVCTHLGRGRRRRPRVAAVSRHLAQSGSISDPLPTFSAHSERTFSFRRRRGTVSGLMSPVMRHNPPRVAAIDLFCGVGGLTFGLQAAGIPVVAGIDVDPACRYPFEANNDAAFLDRDVRDVTPETLELLWPADSVRLLAGCAPCQPFSPHRRGTDTTHEAEWSLLGEFQRLVLATRPELVTMENVPRAASTGVFAEFVEALRDVGYHTAWRSCRGVDFGLPQARRRLVLIASLLGPVQPPSVESAKQPLATVRDAIGELPPIGSGETDPRDPLHTSRKLSAVNLERIRASKPGGTWHDWPEELRAPCHRRASGKSFRNPYGRMQWDLPSPTITTMAHNYGTGRFGHPDQDRPISLREAALLQGFPRQYEFVQADRPVRFNILGRLIGNAVPPPLAEAVGRTIVDHVASHMSKAEDAGQLTLSTR